MRTIRWLVSIILFSNLPMSGEIFMPGTQPNENGTKIAPPKACQACHAKTDNGAHDPYLSWRKGMMSQAGRDPVFRAAVVIANQDVEGVGEFCFRCHTPAGWLEGRSTPADGSSLTAVEVKQGVSCDLCHRLVDPRSEEATSLVKSIPPGLGNAMMVVGEKKLARGPYSDSPKARYHKSIQSEFQASGALCGTCHNVSHPLMAEDISTQPPYAYGHIERTYSEWLLSDFSKNGKSCQSCHFPTVPGGGKATRQKKSPHRDYFITHGAVGGATWIQEATALAWDDSEAIESKSYKAASEKARDLLKTAASLDLKFENAGKAVLRITNLTGHKLPTGYPEGRRMWINVKYLDSTGRVIEENGEFGLKESDLSGQPITVPDLLKPDNTVIYESLPALSRGQAKKYNLEPGPSFHFVLNDTVAKDNRIPPEGYRHDAFVEHHCEPIGAEYADGQNWDEINLSVPPGCQKVVVRLMYQSVTWDYIRFLVEENKTDDWGKRLYDVWLKTGQGQPEVMARIEKGVL